MGGTLFSFHDRFHFPTQTIVVGGSALSGGILDKPWSGRRYRPFPPVRYVPSFVLRRGFSIPNTRRFSSDVAHSRSYTNGNGTRRKINALYCLLYFETSRPMSYIFKFRRQRRDGSRATGTVLLVAGTSLCSGLGKEAPRGGLRGVTTLSGVSNISIFSRDPPGARMAMKDYSENEAVQPTG